MKYAAISEVGLKRKTNQDDYAIISEENIFIVADGMGGHQGGEMASKIAVEELKNFYALDDTLEMTQTEIDLDLDQQRLKNIKQAIRQASRAIYREACIHTEKRGMGTTVVILQLADGKAFVAHVGDSRLYKLNGTKIRQVTKDHSRLQELIDSSQISPEEAENYPFKNVITRALGSGMDIEVDTALFPYTEKDCFFLCSDGVSGVLKDNEIAAIISEFSDDPEQILQIIGDKVEEGGAPDNYTAILIIGDEYSAAEFEQIEHETSPIELDSFKLALNEEPIAECIDDETEDAEPEEKCEDSDEATVDETDDSFSDGDDDNDDDLTSFADTLDEDSLTVSPQSFMSEDDELDLLEKPAPALQGFRLYSEEEVIEQEKSEDFFLEKRKKRKIDGAKTSDHEEEQKKKSNILKKKEAKVKFSHVPDRNTEPSLRILDEEKNVFGDSDEEHEVTGVIKSKEKKKKSDKNFHLSPTSRKILLVITLLVALYVTLCFINNRMYWVRYNGEKNTCDILKGKFHPFESEVIYEIDVVPSELWMMMIQDHDIKTAVNDGKSFFSMEDMNTFIAELFFDLGQRYLAEDGLKQKLVAVNLFRRGKDYGLIEKHKTALLETLYAVAQEYQRIYELDKALATYREIQSLFPQYKDTTSHIQELEERISGAAGEDLTDETLSAH